MPLDHDDDPIDQFFLQDYLENQGRQPDDDETVRCTRCKKWILEDSERCPYCGHYQLADERSRPPLWLILTAILCIFLIGGYLIIDLLGILPW